VDYSKDEIAVVLYYKGLEGKDYEISASGWAEENAGGNSEMNNFKKDLGTFDFGSNNGVWLPDPNSLQTISIILPNIIHSCKKKNL